MPRVVRRPQADADLFDIGTHIAARDVDAAQRLLDRIETMALRLAEYPRMGRAREELTAGLRSFTVSSYVLFYLPFDDGIELVRVLHGARDFDSLFANE